jgi:type II secretory ATPase GspE/PulE/Tfp pilus assembly ATPase PilB-like protein
MTQDAIDFSEIHFLGSEDWRAFEPEVAARELLAFAVEAGASDLFLTDEASCVAIRMRRLGRIEPLQRLSREAGRRLQNHFRAVSGADVTDHMKPVEGRDVIQISDDRSVDVRISALPNVFGQDLALRLFNSDQSLLSIEQLGMEPAELTMVKGLLDSSSGLLLVAGPTGSGKTSSLYSFLRYLNRGDSKIHTLEEPVEYIIPGVVQSQINVRAGVDYAQLLYAVLRHAPDVIMIGEIRDQRTAEIAVRAGGSGQLVLATVHARTCVGAIQSMLAYGINRQFLANSLLGVISQRLVRRLCLHCRMPMDGDDLPSSLTGARRWLPAGAKPTLFLPVGCEQCIDGYDQLTCVPEILKVKAELRRGVAEQFDFDRLSTIARKTGQWSFQTAAQLRLANGTSTLNELVRVIPEDELSDAVDEPTAELVAK